MELQWKSTPCRYLRCVVREVQNQEQTAEVRLPESMPDIGRVLCTWGQPQLREKQWRTEDISVSGGVSAWVLYIPEDGSQPRCIETWIPFQGKWKLPLNTREGFICADVCLRNMDARAISSRKMLVRASVSLMAEAFQPQELALSKPEQVPEDICLLQNTYPTLLAAEAGEKLFSVEDAVSLAGEQPTKLLCCRMNCQITEQAVTGSRAVMRGLLQAHYVYIGEDERIHSSTHEIPFAQFADLEQDYDKEATAWINMTFADSACILDADTLQIKCDLIAQYIIHERHLLQITEDAYSPYRSVSPVASQIELPVQLDRMKETVNADLEMPVQAQSVVDVVFLGDHPVHYRENEKVEVELPGVFQTLYYDMDGNLQSSLGNWAGHCQFDAGVDCNFSISLEQSGQPSAIQFGDQLRLNAVIEMQLRTGALQAMTMITGIEAGEKNQPDPKRPSLILRKTEGLSLWELAKECGSTVEAIEKANGITGQPDPENVLLVPVI